MADWKIKKGNYGWNQKFTVKKTDDTVKDLTGYTVTLRVWSNSTIKFSAECDLDADPTTGICYHTVTETDFDTIGNYFGELELTKTGEKVDCNTFTIQVVATAPTP